MYRCGDGSKWKVYLDTLARSYTPNQITEALRKALPSFEVTIQKYKDEQAAVDAKAGWMSLHQKEEHTK